MDGDVRGQDNWWKGGWVTQFEGPVSSTRRYDYQVALCCEYGGGIIGHVVSDCFQGVKRRSKVNEDGIAVCMAQPKRTGLARSGF